jgi:hypothetical protein
VTDPSRKRLQRRLGGIAGHVPAKQSVNVGGIRTYAENLRTHAKITWRAHERFVTCSSFKASLAACVLASV